VPVRGREATDARAAFPAGGDFGPRGEDFIRISYVGSMDVLKDGLDRMALVVSSVAAQRKRA